MPDDPQAPDSQDRISQEELALISEKIRRREWFRQEVERSLGHQPSPRRRDHRLQPGFWGRLKLALETWRVTRAQRRQARRAIKRGPPPPALAAIFRQLQQSARPGEVSRRVALWKKAISLLPRERDPEQWANFHYGLATELADNWTDAASLEEAIAAFHTALKVFDRKHFPSQWAATMNALGTVYFKRLHGNPSENIERALQLFNEALKVRQRMIMPLEWASTMNNIAEAYLLRPGDRAENLESAIRVLEASLRVVSLETAPEIWAAAQHKLGTAYNHRRYGTDENFQRALKALTSALAVYTREEHTNFWVDIQQELAFAYINRGAGGRAENVEKAITALRQALSVNTRESSSNDWADLQNRLGIALFERLRGEREENLEQAITAYQAALTVWTRETNPKGYATAQMNLANTYCVRILGDPNENQERALAASQEAVRILELYKAQGEPWAAEQWASAQNNLSGIYSVRIAGDPSENIERAIEAAQAALTVYTRDRYPGRWAGTMMTLGNLLSQRIEGDPVQNRRRAVAALEVSTMILGTSTESRVAAANLGQMNAELGDWNRAYLAYRAALEANERLYASGLTEEDKQAEIEDGASLYLSMVEACLRRRPPRPTEAFLYAEGGRSRLLLDQLSRLTIPAPPGVPVDLLENEAALLRRWRELEREISVSADEERRSRAVMEAESVRDRLRSLWATIEREHGAVAYTALRQGDRFKWEEARHWLASQPCRVALLEFFPSATSLFAFIAQDGMEEPEAVELEIHPLEIELAGRRFLEEVRRLDQAQASRQRYEPWKELAGPLLDKVMPHLQGAEMLYIISFGSLHHLPLHAFEIEGKPLIEHFPIAYAPSAAVVFRSAPADRESLEGPVLVVGDPLGDLRAARREAEVIAHRFGVQPLLCEAASQSRVLSQVAGAPLLHFATHAYFDEADPFASGMLLAGREILSARDVLAHSLSSPLVVLSGCETGVQEIRTGEELMGLARAFLYAGATSLIVSQWEVADGATAKLMESLYDHLFEGRVRKTSVAQALRAAMLATREEFPEVYDWAPFLLFGVWR